MIIEIHNILSFMSWQEIIIKWDLRKQLIKLKDFIENLCKSCLIVCLYLNFVLKK